MTLNTENLELIEVSVDKETFFEGDPFNSEGEYIIFKDGEKEMSIGFDIDVDFDIETDAGDGYLTPSFDDVENVEITFDISDFEIDEQDVPLTPRLVTDLNKILSKFISE